MGDEQRTGRDADVVGADAAFAAVAAELLRHPDVEEGTGFGSTTGLRTGGKIFAMLMHGELVLKLPADRCAELIGSGSATAFGVGGRQMREWVSINRVDQDEWLALAGEARSFVG